MAVASQGTPEAFDCHPTLPNNVTPPVRLEHYVTPEYSFYMDGIWTGIGTEAVMILDRQTIVQSGEYVGWRAQKMWWTFDDGVFGPLALTGYRLDGEAPEAVDLYATGEFGVVGFTPIAMAFESPGCWQIVGIVGDHVTSFTMQVEFVGVYPWMATPAA